MIEWWLTLSIDRQIALTIALASTIVLFTQIVLVIINFYGVDKLNSGPENLELYEKIANHDSDMSKDKIRILSLRNINIFMGISCLCYFLLYTFLELYAVILISLTLATIVTIVYTVVYMYLKRRIKKTTPKH